MSIKLIAIDIDGTLINDQLEITEKTKETLQKATAQGIKVVLCTGRPMTGVHKYLDQLGINNLADQYVISFNGALAQTTSGQVISQFTLPFENSSTSPPLPSKRTSTSWPKPPTRCMS